MTTDVAKEMLDNFSNMKGEIQKRLTDYDYKIQSSSNEIRDDIMRKFEDIE